MKQKLLLLTCVIAVTLLDTGCGTTPNTPDPDPVWEMQNKKPDSVYKYNIAADGVEKLAQITYYTYDEKGNMTLQWDTMTTHNGKRKISITYNAKGLKTEQQDCSFSTTDNEWGRIICYQYSYNADNRLDTIFWYEDFSPLANPNKKYVYSWTDGTHADCLVYNYDSSLPEVGPWIIQSRIEYTYNTRGEVEKATAYYLFGSNSTTGGKLWFTEEYTYDQYGNILFSKLFYYDNEDMQRTAYYKYVYDSRGRVFTKWYTDSAEKESNSVYIAKYVYFY